MAGEFAIDSMGTANAINMNPGAYGQSTIDAVNEVTGLNIVVAPSVQVISTPDGAPFGYVVAPDGWDVKTQGLPPGSSVGYSMEAGVSIIYDGLGHQIGQMVAPLQPFDDPFTPTLPVQTIPYQWVKSSKGIYVPVIPHSHKVKILGVWMNRVGHAAPTWWGVAEGRNYGGPDGGPSNG